MQVYSELQPNSLQEDKPNLTLSVTGNHSRYAEKLWYWLLQVVNDNHVLECLKERIMEHQLLADVSEVVTCFDAGLCEDYPPLID